MPTQKIATCCYCGTRAALVLKGEDRHELVCSSCGAPLHDLKMLPKQVGTGADRLAGGGQAVRSSGRAAPKPAHPKQPHPKAKKAKKPKKRKGLFRNLMEEAWDVIEDIID